MVNKQQLIDHVTGATRFPRGQVDETITAFMEGIIDKLAVGERVHLAGFGTFEVKERKGRNGVDPRSLKPIKIPTVRVAKFKASKTMKAAVK